MWRKGKPSSLLVGMQTGAASVEQSTEFTQNIKNETAFQPSDPTSGNVSKETWNTNLKDHMHPCVHCSIIYNSQDMETAQVSIGRWVYSKAMTHLHNGILRSHDKEETLTFCDSIDGPGEHYAKRNKPVRERQVPYDFTHMCNLMNK